MPRWLTNLMQAVATAGQVLNIYGALVPVKYQIPITAVLGVASIVVNNIAHSYNPDGTPVAVPYIKKETK